jgi:hypothetical protein
VPLEPFASGLGSGGFLVFDNPPYGYGVHNRRSRGDAASMGETPASCRAAIVACRVFSVDQTFRTQILWSFTPMSLGTAAVNGRLWVGG